MKLTTFVTLFIFFLAFPGIRSGSSGLHLENVAYSTLTDSPITYCEDSCLISFWFNAPSDISIPSVMLKGYSSVGTSFEVGCLLNDGTTGELYLTVYDADNDDQIIMSNGQMLCDANWHYVSILIVNGDTTSMSVDNDATLFDPISTPSLRGWDTLDFGHEDGDYILDNVAAFTHDNGISTLAQIDGLAKVLSTFPDNGYIEDLDVKVVFYFSFEEEANEQSSEEFTLLSDFTLNIPEGDAVTYDSPAPSPDSELEGEQLSPTSTTGDETVTFRLTNLPLNPELNAEIYYDIDDQFYDECTEVAFVPEPFVDENELAEVDMSCYMPRLSNTDALYLSLNMYSEGFYSSKIEIQTFGATMTDLFPSEPSEPSETIIENPPKPSILIDFPFKTIDIPTVVRPPELAGELCYNCSKCLSKSFRRSCNKLKGRTRFKSNKKTGERTLCCGRLQSNNIVNFKWKGKGGKSCASSQRSRTNQLCTDLGGRIACTIEGTIRKPECRFNERL